MLDRIIKSQNQDLLWSIASFLCNEADDQLLPWCDVIEDDSINHDYTFTDFYNDKYNYHTREKIALDDVYFFHHGCCAICGGKFYCHGRHLVKKPHINKDYEVIENNVNCIDQGCVKILDFFESRDRDWYTGSFKKYKKITAERRVKVKKVTGKTMAEIYSMGSGLRYPILLNAMMEIMANEQKNHTNN